MIRLNTSSPRSEVPKKWVRLGVKYLAERSRCVGLYGNMLQPNIASTIAVRMNTATITKPIFVSRLNINNLQIRDKVSLKEFADPLLFGWLALMTSLIWFVTWILPVPDSRVNDGVQYICHKIHSDDYGRKDQSRG